MGGKYFEETREEMLAFIPETSIKILEVGCGQGNFGKLLLEKRSIEIWGIEPHYDSYISASKHYHRVINEIFNKDLNLPRNYFDCIIFNDVLEHMDDPSENLFFSKDFLKKNHQSYLVSSIPNFNYIKNLYQIVIKSDFRYENSGILDRTHLRFFTKKSIERLFTEAGFEIKIIQGINPSINPIFKVINFLSFRSLEDKKYLQYAVVASVKE